MLGVPLLDPLCAVGVSAMVLRIGAGLFSKSFSELTDKVHPERLDGLRDIISQVPGVVATPR